MVKENVKYYFLIERKRDGKKFVSYGNPKIPGNRIGYLYEFAPESYHCPVWSPFGLIYNISCDIRYNSKDYRVIKQYAM